MPKPGFARFERINRIFENLFDLLSSKIIKNHFRNKSDTA